MKMRELHGRWILSKKKFRTKIHDCMVSAGIIMPDAGQQRSRECDQQQDHTGGRDQEQEREWQQQERKGGDETMQRHNSESTVGAAARTRGANN